MAEYEATSYRALLLQDTRATTLDTTNSTVTQAGPTAGVPDPQQDTDLVMTAFGSQTASSVLKMEFVRGGFPGRAATAAALAWKQTADTNYRGWEAPCIITGWEAVDWTTGTTDNKGPTLLNYRGTEGIGGTQQDRVMCVYSQITGGNVRTRIRRRGTTTHAWGGASSIHSETSAGAYSKPMLVQMPAPSGRLLCFFVTWDTGVASTMNVRMSYSDDVGVTWAVGSSLCLPANISTATISCTRLRVALHNGQILLVLHLVDTARTYDDYLVQYASDDYGVSFTSIESGADTEAGSGGYPDIAICDDAFVVGYIPIGDLIPVTKRIGSAYIPMSAVPAIPAFDSVMATKTANVFDRGEFTICADERGTLWAYGLYADGTARSTGHVARSDTGGRSWTHTGAWFTQDDTSAAGSQAHPDVIHARWQRGRVMMAHNWNASPGNEDSSLGIAYLGGFSTHVVPAGTNGGTGTILDWEQTWIPIEEPMDVTGGYWTASGVAATEDLVTPGLLRITTSANQRYYTVTPGSTTFASGLAVEFGFARADGAARVRVVLSDGVNDYDVEVVKDGTGYITLTDNNAGPATVATAAVTEATVHIVRLFVGDGVVACHYRTTGTGEDREWTAISNGAAITQGVGGTSAISWGTPAVNDDHDITFSRFQWGRAWSRADAQTNPDDLVGMPVAPVPSYIDDGVYVQATDGPAYQGDAWWISTRYAYPADNLLITEDPSRDATWRGTGTADALFAYELQAGEGGGVYQQSLFESQLWGLWLDDCNAGVVNIERRNGGSFAAALGVSSRTSTVSFTRTGASVEITLAADGPFWLGENELVGMDFGLSATVGRRIVSNTGGYVGTASGTVKRPRLYLTGVATGTDPTSGSDGLIYWPRTLTLWSFADSVTADGIRITLGSGASRPTSSLGYLTASRMVFGPVMPLGWPYHHDRVRTRRPAVDLHQSVDGNSRARHRGRIREEFALNWQAIDERALFAGDDYVLASDVASVTPLAMRRDAARLIRGLQDRLDGPALPMVYAPYVPHLTAAVTTLRMPQSDAPTLVRAIGDLQVRTDRGVEGKTELMSLGLTLREEG